MLEVTGMPANPMSFALIAILIGFGVVVVAKIYGLFFMRWKTQFRVGEAMNVRRAEVVEWVGREGYVKAGGELWKAASKDSLTPGDNVAIASVNGLVLSVKKK